MAITINEIARLAGVSTGTVSRVLNDRPRVSAETRERVKRIVEQFDYRPSAMARGLQGRKTGAVMLVVPWLDDSYYLRSIHRINAKLREKGLRLVLGSSDMSAKVEADYLRQAMDGMVDGLIITPLPATPETTRLYATLAARRFPVVTIEEPCPGGVLPNLRYDDAGDVARATEGLFRQGFSRVAFLASAMNFATVRNRHLGWLEAYRNAGKVSAPELSLVSECGAKTFDFAPLLALARRSVAAAEPLAVLAQNDMLALSAILALDRAGIRVQVDVVVVGHGETYPPEFQKYPMSSVSIPWMAMCDRAVERLLAGMNAQDGDDALEEHPVEVLTQSDRS